MFLPLDRTFHQWYGIDTKLDLYWIASGFRLAFVSGMACQQETLILPNTWFRPFLGLSCVPVVETSFPELALSFPGFSSWISLGTFSILFDTLLIATTYSSVECLFLGQHEFPRSLVSSKNISWKSKTVRHWVGSMIDMDVFIEHFDGCDMQTGGAYSLFRPIRLAYILLVATTVSKTSWFSGLCISFLFSFSFVYFYYASLWTMNTTYNLTDFSASEVLDNNKSVLTSFGIETIDDDLDLQYIYIGHNAQNPYKHPFIAGSSKCSSKPLSILLQNCLSNVFGRTCIAKQPISEVDSIICGSFRIQGSYTSILKL